MLATEAPRGVQAAGAPRGVQATEALRAMHATGALAEADRLMTICNACRYCEGLCAVFPAMEMRRAFADGDLDYLANLCHGCGACYVDCQFSPPHAFDVNVPRTLAKVRAESWARYAWPGVLRPVFRRNGVWIGLAAATAVAAFVAGFAAAADPAALFASGAEPGAFYRVMPHGLMAALFGAAFLYAAVAMALSLRAFWRATGAPADALSSLSLARAGHDAATLRYLDGGGAGCVNAEESPNPAPPPDRRRLWHHLAFYGFLLCFASTCVATLYHYLFAREAPYPWWDAPVLLGVAGGLGLVAGSLGLLAAKRARDPALVDADARGMDAAFTIMLLLAGATGLALLALRATPAMGLLLAAHLGVVFALFVTAPYGRFVHGLYRYAALVRYARERDRLAAEH